MALEHLLSALEAEAAEEAERRAAAADAEAQRILEAARAEARAIEEHAGEVEARDVRLETDLLRARARLAAATAAREAREEGFLALQEDVRARLSTLRASSAYAGVLRELIRECLTALPHATTMLVDPRDEGLATELLRELDPGRRLRLQPLPATDGGVEVKDAAGRSVRNTLEERLANAEPGLRLAFGAALAAAPNGPSEPPVAGR